ncbi:MAG: hypothetical protein WBD50_03225 [Candidatus Rhabdochlamydia sp.]
MSIQSSSVLTITLPLKTIMELKESNCELQKKYKKAVTELKVTQQANEILEAKNTELENRCTKFESEKTENGRFVQLVDENLQSSKRVLQCVCAIAGAILGGGLVLAFPPAGAAIALAGTGPAAAGVALVGGATGGCLVAPIVHEKTNNALIQQVQNFKAKEEVSKKAE